MICYTPGSGGSFDSFAVSISRTFRTYDLLKVFSILRRPWGYPRMPSAQYSLD